MRTRVLMALYALSSSAVALSTAGAKIKTVPCEIIAAIFKALASVGPALVATYFVYGGIKYVYSADDPGGRKQGKTIMIHALIGAVLMMVLDAIMQLTGLKNAGVLCAGMI